MSKRVLVLGNTGFLGRRTTRALVAQDAADVRGGGRRTGIDLTDPSTFSRLQGYDVVVNCADTVGAPPDAAARHVVEAGGVFVESTADAGTVQRLLDAEWSGDGTLVVGAGLFPGLSNLLAAEAARGVVACEELQLGVRFSPLCGCGPGTVDMMVNMLESDGLRVEGGRLTAGPPLAPGPELPFPAGQRGTVRAGFCEPQLLARSLDVSAVSANMAPVPALARPLMLGLSWLPRWLLANPLARALNRVSLRLLRVLLLSWRASGVELVAVARGGGQTCVRSARVEDGFTATGHATAALVGHLLEHPPSAGLLTVDQAIDCDALVNRMRAQGCAVEREAPEFAVAL